MKRVELYGQVRRAVYVEGISQREDTVIMIKLFHSRTWLPVVC